MAVRPQASVHIGPIKEGRAIARRFYAHCSREVVEAGRITTTPDPSTFDTLEDLVDQLSVGMPAGFQLHVVVCHGNPLQGILVPLSHGSNSRYDATGVEIAHIADQVERIRRHQSVEPNTLADLASEFGLSKTPDSLTRLLQKMAALPPSIIEFRGCHLAENGPGLLLDYKRAFNAISISAPDARMFYVPVSAHRPRHHQTMAQVSAGTPRVPPGGREARRRTFTGPSLPMFVLDVIDMNGHAHIQSEAFMDAPDQNGTWARAIDENWTGPAHDGFVAQVIWVNAEHSYHTPYDVSYRKHLIRV